MLSRLIKRFPSLGRPSFATSGRDKKQESSFTTMRFTVRFFVLALKQTPQLRPQLRHVYDGVCALAGDCVIGECQSRECDFSSEKLSRCQLHWQYN